MYLLEVAIEATTKVPHFPFAATAVLVIGFVAAVTMGSIAWYNSKRPPGWENKERPDVVPKVDS
ncbi:MAG: hypothetical protein F6K18_03185 [Okeania sp. SIO2C2]|uniref:photosystem II assembly protein Psb35 n=1 Tax=Okeania sp. SIO2C2 TaxID=2607787 RepID=UPI0013BE84FD|nr:hypothetical protein [Okeania sp. SIO2C2]NEP85901.1 hypothetical protein [Okeania sp. SIO2C2]